MFLCHVSPEGVHEKRSWWDASKCTDGSVKLKAVGARVSLSWSNSHLPPLLIPVRVLPVRYPADVAPLPFGRRGLPDMEVSKRDWMRCAFLPSVLQKLHPWHWVGPLASDPVRQVTGMLGRVECKRYTEPLTKKTFKNIKVNFVEGWCERTLVSPENPEILQNIFSRRNSSSTFPLFVNCQKSSAQKRGRDLWQVPHSV